MSSAAVRKLIKLAAELSEDERRVVVDAIAPKESIARLAEEWESEIYPVLADTVHILASMHPRQRPGYWAHRVSSS